MALGKKSTLREVLNNKEGRKVLEKYFGELLNHPMIKMISNMTLEHIVDLSGGRITNELLNRIDKDLSKIK